MKKTVQISLAKSLFTIEDDAYQQLDQYLATVKKHFLHTEGKDEIIQDIESRIAEQFAEADTPIITIVEVEQVIASMGTVEQFEEEEGKAAPENGKVHPLKKKLYRNPDNSVIAGVSSGLAAYFGIDPIIVRLAFVLLFFVNGLGALAYIVFLFVMPAAKTASQKLEMQGSDVTLESLSEVSRTASGNDTFIMRCFSALGAVIRIGFAAFCFVGALSALAGLVFALPYIVSFPFDTYIDFPVWEVVSRLEFYTAVAAGYVSVLIPLILVMLLSIALFIKRQTISASLGYWSLGFWIVSCIIATLTVSHMSVAYQKYVTSNPGFESVTQTIPVSDSIRSLYIERGARVELVQGDTAELTVTGLRKNVEKYSANVQDSELRLSSSIDANKVCPFCPRQITQYTVTLPALDAIQIHQGSRLTTSSWETTAPLTVDIKNGSYATLNVTAPSLELGAANGSSMYVTGSASGATLSADTGTTIDAEELYVNTATVSAQRGSSVYINAKDLLNAKARDGASIHYRGKPETVIEQTSGGSVRLLKDEE